MTQRLPFRQMPRPQPDTTVRIERWDEKRQTRDVIPMGMCEIKIQIDGRRLRQLPAQLAQTRSSVEHDQVLTAPDFEARGVAAVANRIWPGDRYATTDAPEADREFTSASQRLLLQEDSYPDHTLAFGVRDCREKTMKGRRALPLRSAVLSFATLDAG